MALLFSMSILALVAGYPDSCLCNLPKPHLLYGVKHSIEMSAVPLVRSALKTAHAMNCWQLFNLLPSNCTGCLQNSKEIKQSSTSQSNFYHNSKKKKKKEKPTVTIVISVVSRDSTACRPGTRSAGYVLSRLCWLPALQVGQKSSISSPSPGTHKDLEQGL